MNVYPSWRYHRELPPKLIKGPDEEHPDWKDTPAAFTAEPAPKPKKKAAAPPPSEPDEELGHLEPPAPGGDPDSPGQLEISVLPAIGAYAGVDPVNLKAVIKSLTTTEALRELARRIKEDPDMDGKRQPVISSITQRLRSIDKRQ